MSAVKILLAPRQNMGDFYFTKNQAEYALKLYVEGKYEVAGNFYFNETGETAAEEAFDLTNNPAREYERAKYYGNKRSISVGDIVEVDEELFLCASFGWIKIAI